MRRERLSGAWALCATPPGQFESAADLAAGAADWLPLGEAMPVAAALRESGRWTLDGAPQPLDAFDWWYRFTLAPADVAEGETAWLVFDGLAGVADVWLDGKPVLHSSNMFVPQEIPLAGLGTAATLVLRFRSLDALLARQRPRPRWRTPMVAHQQLRWWRTTLLGHTPGWSPPAPAIGPWRGAWLELRADSDPADLGLTAQLLADGSGRVEATCLLAPQAHERGVSLELEVALGDEVHRVPMVRAGEHHRAELTLAQPRLWWPHTHGEPVRYRTALVVHDPRTGRTWTRPGPAVGFRTLSLATAGGDFSLHVNGVPVFCRGACWMPLDPVSLAAAPGAERAAVLQACEAGMNMLRVSGTTVYGSDEFLDACDELGVLVWHEFMFASMDYPGDDEAFAASVRSEARAQLRRWQGRPAIAVVCGNSEVEQQAAMWGAAREQWAPRLFHEVLRAEAAAVLAATPYWPSSAHGGSWPQQPDTGTTSYYGVGAYLRPLEDARRSGLRFATECLAFANVPGAEALARMPGGAGLRAHHPGWKQRVPRDLGAGWDFEDVRDFYLELLYGVDAARLRATEHERYLALSRVVTGEVMARSFDEWRRVGSACRGALVWTLRDLWAGAGWGVLDEQGGPKACFHALARALQPVAVALTDEGHNGIAVHLHNERPQPLEGRLHITLFGPSGQRLEQAERSVSLAPRSSSVLPAGELFDHFVDLSYAFRFGPPAVSLVHAQLAVPGAAAPEAFFHPAGIDLGQRHDLGLAARLERDGAGWVLVLSCERPALYVAVAAEQADVADNHFHLAPGAPRRIALKPRGAGAATPPPCRVEALNGDRAVVARAQ